MVDVDVSGSRAVGAHGGGIYGERLARLSITGSLIADNRVAAASGGGIYSRSTDPSRASELIMVDSVVRNNAVAGNYLDGGGVKADDMQLLRTSITSNRLIGDGARGGGILARSVRLVESVVSRNLVGGGSHTQRGGGISATDVTVVDSTIAYNTAGNSEGGFGGGISAVTVSVTGSTFTGNFAFEGSGGAISGDNVMISQSIISANRAGSAGGAIAARALHVANSTLSGNSATWQAGAITSRYFRGESSIVVVNSTLNNNRVNLGGPSGGGISVVRGSIEILHSTIAGGTGAIEVLGEGEVSILVDSSILATDRGRSSFAGQPLGDLELRSETVTLTMANSIIGDNTGSSLEESQTRDARGNLIGSSSGEGIIDPLLGPLADNGGPTPTRALLPGSPAIDAGSAESDDATDQRGGPYRRVVGAASDIGAFEVQTPRCVEPSGVSDIDLCAADIEERDLILAEIGSPLGDLNDDASVSVADFLILSRNFGKDEDSFFSEGDLNLDGVIDVRDFLVLSLNFATNA